MSEPVTPMEKCAGRDCDADNLNSRAGWSGFYLQTLGERGTFAIGARYCSQECLLNAVVAQIKANPGHVLNVPRQDPEKYGSSQE